MFSAVFTKSFNFIKMCLSRFMLRIIFGKAIFLNRYLLSFHMIFKLKETSELKNLFYFSKSNYAIMYRVLFLGCLLCLIF